MAGHVQTATTGECGSHPLNYTRCYITIGFQSYNSCISISPDSNLPTSFKLSAESLPVLSHPPNGDFGCPGPPIYFMDLEVRDIRKVPTASKLTDAVNEPAIFQGASEGLINVLAVGVV